ncbi:MAG: L-lactate permease [SAR324 cluster bacterium]|nr:L-lactate permease [SAR324 cluster bacterium]
MQTLAALAPLALLIVAMLAFNLPARRAALLALLLLASLSISPGVVPSAGEAWLSALPDALLLTLTVGLTLFFGLLLHRLMDDSGALAVLLDGVRSLGRDPAQRLMWVLLVFGPLFESISGFGLAIMIVAPMLLGLGYTPSQALTLSLISQLAVPWGALAIGMVLGAAMAKLSLPMLGAATAVLALPVHAAFWGTALWIAKPAGAWSLRPLAGSAAALAVFGCGIWAANRWVSPELGGLAGPALLAGWLLLLGGGAGEGRPPRAALLRAAAPYLALVAVLVATRFFDPLRDWLNQALVLRLPGSGFSLPLLYNPGAALAVACAVTFAVAFKVASASGPDERGRGRGRPGAAGLKNAVLKTTVLKGVLGQWWRVVSALFVLILLARFMFEGGLLRALAASITSLSGGAGAGWFIPPIAGLGGFLTGSVAGANALFLDLQALLAGGAGLPLLWVTAVHTLLAAGFSAMSPARVVFAATMTGLHGQEGLAMRRLLPLAAMLLLIGAVALSPGVLAWLVRAKWLVGG